MKFCKYCGAQLSDDLKFCTNCGKEVGITTPAQPVYTAPVQPEQETYTQPAEPVYTAPVQPEPEGYEPVYTAPVQPEPVYTAPVQPTQPVYTTPVQPQPVYTAPVQPTQPKKNYIGLIIAIVAVVVLLAGAAAFWFLGPIYVKNIDIKEDEVTISKGKTSQVEITINPANPILEKADSLTWESSDEDVATVKDGKITAVDKGECKITITSKKGVKAEVEVTVEVLPEKIEISSTSVEINIDSTYSLDAEITPDDVSEGYEEITWESDDEDIATVDEDGEVTGISEGSCTITAKTENGLKATCKVKVVEKAEIALITGTWTSTQIYADEYGSLIPAAGISTITIEKDGNGIIVISTETFDITWKFSEIDSDGDYEYVIYENAYSGYYATICQSGTFSGKLCLVFDDYMYIYERDSGYSA